MQISNFFNHEEEKAQDSHGRGYQRSSRKGQNAISNSHALEYDASRYSYRSNEENDHDQENYESGSKILLMFKKGYIYFVTNIICLFLIIFNIQFAYSLDGVELPVLSSIESHFRRSLVIDIFLIDKYENCQSPYQLSSMGVWPGYKSICKCDSYTLPRQCHDSEGSDCKNVGPYTPIQLSIWDGKKMCLRKSSKSIIDYYHDSNLIETPNGNFVCPNDMKKCILSTVGNFICVSRFEICPITKVLIEPQDILQNPNRTKWKYEYQFNSKLLLFDNELGLGTTFLDIIAQSPNCNTRSDTYYATPRCYQPSELDIIDNSTEYTAIGYNIKNQSMYSPINEANQQFNLYSVPVRYLDQCPFNKDYNPLLFEEQMNNWRKISVLLFINPFFLSTLLVLNIIRIVMLRYINKRHLTRKSQLRKKEIYQMFGKYFVGSFLIIACQIIIILYFILWGYLLLNENRIFIEQWTKLSCLDQDTVSDLNVMLDKVNKVETYNMIIIGPMIICCILEALFSQYRLIKVDIHEQLRDLS